MLTSLIAFGLLVPANPALAPERPRDIWAFRSVLDNRARMLTLALHKDLWVAYDATNCGLYRAWSGGVKFDGAVYTTVHGPQPTSMGTVHVPGITDRPVWTMVSGGKALNQAPEFKGYRFQNGQIQIQYRFRLPGRREVWVYETPEAAPKSDTAIELMRAFSVKGLRAGEEVVLTTVEPVTASGRSFGYDGRLETVSRQAIGEKEFETVRLWLNADKATTLRTNVVIGAEADTPDLTHGDLQEPQTPREQGVSLRVYWIGKDMDKIPTLLGGQTPNYSVRVPRIDLKNGDFGPDKDQFYAKVTGFLNVEREGDYHFRLFSDDGSKFMIRDEIIIDNDGLHGAQDGKDGSFKLSRGEHPFEIEMFDNAVDEALRLEWKKPGDTSWSLVPDSALTTPEGEVRVTAPGKKGIFDPAGRWRPGDGLPLTGVHPGLDLETVRPADFKPRVGGIDFLKDGRMVVCTWDADGAVYILDGVQAKKPHEIKVKRIAAGLAEPLGIKVVDGDVYVLQKQELTRLRDLNGDEISDEYFTFANGWGVTSNFHEFAFGLEYMKGHFYGSLATAINPGGSSTQPQNQDRGTVVQISKDGDYKLIARGLRTPNGMGFGAKGRLYIADNQGDWLPSSKILLVKEGAFYGNRSVRPEIDKNTPEYPPVVWLPQNEIGNSPSQIAPINFGPYKGQQVHGDVTHGGLKRVFVEEVDGILQGCVFRFTQGLEAGVNRVIVGPDGAFYVGGIGSTGNWGQEGKERFGLQRLSPNGAVPFEPLAVRAFANGLEIELTKPLIASMGNDPGDYTVEQWRYVPTVQYGGPKVDQQMLTAKSVTVSRDRKKVFLELPLKPNHVVYIKLGRGLATAGEEMLWTTEAWYTLNRIPNKRHSVSAQARPVNQLTPEESREGFKLLFDGKSADQWRGWKKQVLPTKWKVVDGELRITPGPGSGGDIITKEQFGDFDLRLEWKVEKAGNSGIFIRSDESKQLVWSTGMEMQVLDDDLHPDGRSILTSAGSHYAMHARTRDVVRPAERWNEVRIVCKGKDVTFWLNGFKVVEYTIGSQDWIDRKAKSKFASLPDYGNAPVGHIALQDHGNRVSFRNIRIRKL